MQFSKNVKFIKFEFAIDRWSDISQHAEKLNFCPFPPGSAASNYDKRYRLPYLLVRHRSRWVPLRRTGGRIHRRTN